MFAEDITRFQNKRLALRDEFGALKEIQFAALTLIVASTPRETRVSVFVHDEQSRHWFVEHVHCEDIYCFTCAGGLAWCGACGCAEAELAKECPITI